MSNVEQPSYSVAERNGDIEIRDYVPMIVAETEVTGARDAAIRDGFRRIADYIFGNNLDSQKIAMTAPVTQQGDGQAWRVSFVMPASSKMETLSKPKNPAVRLKAIEGKRFAVIRFSGTGGEDNLTRHAEQLRDEIIKKNLNPLSDTSYAFYDPPWTLPFLRRNEIMIEIAAGP